MRLEYNGKVVDINEPYTLHIGVTDEKTGVHQFILCGEMVVEATQLKESDLEPDTDTEKE